MIEIGPTGKLIQGHLYDVNRKSFEQVLTNFDSKLYLVWNAAKRRGLGCWELRRQPETKTQIPQGLVPGGTISTLEYVENDLVNHVYDIPFLNYQVLDRLKKFDMWADANWVENFVNEEQAAKEAAQTRARADMRYNLKQDRKTFRVFKEMVASGVNPALI